MAINKGSNGFITFSILVFASPIPTNSTDPHVNKVVAWNPINISVITKLATRAGRYLIPNNAGT